LHVLLRTQAGSRVFLAFLSKVHGINLTRTSTRSSYLLGWSAVSLSTVNALSLSN
jgi:hypothetical protein